MVITHQPTSSPSNCKVLFLSPPSPATLQSNPYLRSRTSNPCLALRQHPGQTTPMPHTSQPCYTSQIRNLLLELSLVRYSMVWCSIWHLPIVAHLCRLTPLLGVTTAMFFRCMRVLLSPVDPIKGARKWAFVAHTVAMFAFLTIPGIGLNFSSTCYVDNRAFPGAGGYPPGPIGYDLIIKTEAANVIFNVMFPLNQWLADGLLVCLIPNSVP